MHYPRLRNRELVTIERGRNFAQHPARGKLFAADKVYTITK